MDLNIRGEMEAAASEMESQGESFDGGSEDASPASETETTGTSESDTAAVSATPATEETPAETPKDVPAETDEELPIGGSIPVPRVRKILENARAKARAEVEAKLNELAWARDRKREEVENALRIVEYANTNPVEFYRHVTEQLRADPALRGEVERIWPSSTPAPDASVQTPKPEERPQPDVLLEDGRLVYSAEQMERLLDWKVRQVEGTVAKTIEPVIKERAQERARERLSMEAERLYREALKWPGMDNAENRAEVAKVMAERRMTLDAAWREVVVPKLTDTKAIEERVRQEVLRTLKAKSAASTPNPQRVIAPADSFKGKSVREILEATAAELNMLDEE